MAEGTPLISVIIPCFNVEQYVVRAVESILKQTYQHLEIWLIDDASTDGTLSLLQSFKDARIKIYAAPQNTKKIGAVNEVLRNVAGDFVAFQDADDWAAPDRLEKQLEAMQRDEQIGICFTNYSINGAWLDTYQPSITDDELKDEFHRFGNRIFTSLKPTCCPSMMITSAALKETGGYHPYFKGRVAEDIQWIYRILKYFKGTCVPGILYHYTVRDDSLSGIQMNGTNAKAAYSWQLLKRIIQLDLVEHIDALSDDNLMRSLELEACEEALCEQIQLTRSTIMDYKSSRSYRLGNLMLRPFRMLLNQKK